MTKIQSRLKTLRNRREKLIELNQKYHYTQMGNAKVQKYYNCILAVRKEISELEHVNVRPAKARVGMTVKDLRNLTNPIL